MLTLAAALVLASNALTPPPMLEAPSLVSARREARLLDEGDVQPTEPSTLAARMVLAPVLGAAGGAAGGALGLFGGVGLGMLAGAGWGSLAAGALFGIIFSAVGLVVGTAIGAALFADGFRDLFARSLPWALLAVGVATVVSIVAAFMVPAAALAISIGSGIVATAVVPLIVEARRLATAQPVERAPEAAVPLTTF